MYIIRIWRNLSLAVSKVSFVCLKLNYSPDWGWPAPESRAECFQHKCNLIIELFPQPTKLYQLWLNFNEIILDEIICWRNIFTELIFNEIFLQSRIEGEQTFSVIRNNTMNQVQVGEIVVGDILMVGHHQLWRGCFV